MEDLNKKEGFSRRGFSEDGGCRGRSSGCLPGIGQSTGCHPRGCRKQGSISAEEWKQLEDAVAAIPVTGDRYNAEQQKQVGF